LKTLRRGAGGRPCVATLLPNPIPASDLCAVDFQMTGFTQACRLNFHPSRFFALGSPLGLFLAMRQQGSRLAQSHKLPTCPKLYNIFHPNDPVAYRIEPLFDPDFKKFSPASILLKPEGFSLHKVTSQIAKRVQDAGQRLSYVKNWSEFAGNILSIANTDTSTTEVEMERARLESKLTGILMNEEQRIDYALPSQSVETVLTYLNALSCHIGYFDDVDLSR